VAHCSQAIRNGARSRGASAGGILNRGRSKSLRRVARRAISGGKRPCTTPRPRRRQRVERRPLVDLGVARSRTRPVHGSRALRAAAGPGVETGFKRSDLARDSFSEAQDTGSLLWTPPREGNGRERARCPPPDLTPQPKRDQLLRPQSAIGSELSTATFSGAQESAAERTLGEVTE
jgi:hypothetical protein